MNGATSAMLKPSSARVTARLLKGFALEDIWAAGLDVFEKEPIEPDHPILRSPYVLLTPHQAWYSEDGGYRDGRLSRLEARNAEFIRQHQ